MPQPSTNQTSSGYNPSKALNNNNNNNIIILNWRYVGYTSIRPPRPCVNPFAFSNTFESFCPYREASLIIGTNLAIVSLIGVERCRQFRMSLFSLK
jgi:hypothetical protein